MTTPTDNAHKCHPRRHMTPSEFMTYDTLRAMAKPDEATGCLICYARLTTVANHNNLSTDQNARNIKALVGKEWLVDCGRPRWRGGFFGTNHYQVLTHEEFVEESDGLHPCPPFTYDKDGEKIEKLDADLARDFSIKMSLRKWIKSNRGWLDKLADAFRESGPAIEERLRREANEKAG